MPFSVEPFTSHLALLIPVGVLLMLLGFLLLAQCAFLDKAEKPKPKQSKKAGGPKEAKSGKSKKQQQHQKDNNKAIRSTVGSAVGSTNSSTGLKGSKSQLKNAGQSSEGLGKSKSTVGAGVGPNRPKYIPPPPPPGGGVRLLPPKASANEKQSARKSDDVGVIKVGGGGGGKAPGKIISDLKVGGAGKKQLKDNNINTAAAGKVKAKSQLAQKSSAGGMKILANKSSTFADSEEVEFKTELFDVEPSGGA